MSTPSVPNTNVLRPYTPAPFSLDVGRFVQTELQKVATSIKLIVQVLEQHEARLASGGL